MADFKLSLSIKTLSDLVGLNRTQDALKKLQATSANAASYRNARQALLQTGQAYRSAEQNPAGSLTT